MDSHSSTLPPRNLAALLDETFFIFGRHFRGFIGLVAVVQLPVSVSTLVILEHVGGGSFVWNALTLIAAFLIGVFGSLFAYGAAVFAVGQQYVTGEIAIRSCYTKAWLRVRSLWVLTLAVAAAFAIFLVPLSVSDQTVVLMLAFLLMVGSIAIFIYWSMSVQAMIVEGRKDLGALRRSATLVLRNWWRVFGITLVLGLVGFGLAVLVSIPFFFIALGVPGFAQGSAVSEVLLLLADSAVRITVLPVLFIGGTLLYYDLRVRNEEYDFATLSREMGIAAA